MGFWTRDEEVARLVRPMTERELAEHQDPRGTGRCPWARQNHKPVDAGMRSGRRLSYGLAAMRRSES